MSVDPLPSWRDVDSKRRIIEFVQQVTNSASAHFVPSIDRIAVFDNDGTLWAEKPMYVQLQFAIDRVKQLAKQSPESPEWSRQPFRGILGGDLSCIREHKALLDLVGVTHCGMTTVEFDAIVQEWITSVKHTRFNRPFTDLTYEPMKELINYLTNNGFKCYIVSAGGLDFMRPWAEEAYGVPRERMVGSTVHLRYHSPACSEVGGGEGGGQTGVTGETVSGERLPPTLIREKEIHWLNDGDKKPAAIERVIGRRPIAAFGNSDGDIEMLKWTTHLVSFSPNPPSPASPSPASRPLRLGVLIHHTDEQREWAYDRETEMGRLDRGLSEVEREGWVLVDMKRDWDVVFGFQRETKE
eukprot:GHVN01044301.1.p1 GENE.GHVN01044301.1~~GHVN01044301.1.p1  ORF type:complete len:354 (-),score=70.63 GHVN01044301.1:87-1148(-)